MRLVVLFASVLAAAACGENHRMDERLGDEQVTAEDVPSPADVAWDELLRSRHGDMPCELSRLACYIMRWHVPWFDDSLRQILTASDLVYFESERPADRSEFENLSRRHMNLPAGKSLTDWVDDSDLQRLRAEADRIGIEWSELEQKKPGFAALLLTDRRLKVDGRVNAPSVERTILETVREAGIDTAGLVSFETNMRNVSELPSDTQIKFLQRTLTHDDVDSFDQLMLAWSTGDLEEVQKLAVNLPREAQPELYQALMVDRSKAWVEQIAELMEGFEGQVFVVAGIGHLVGSDSLQRGLQQRGYTATRLQ